MPPLTATVAAPVIPPLQVTFVELLMLAVNAVGWVMVTLVVFTHPAASVILAVYVPADKLLAVEPV